MTTEIKDLNIQQTANDFIKKDVYKESFRFIKTGSFTAAQKAVKAYWHIGEIVNYFAKTYTQKQAAALRNEALKDLNLSNNEITGCKKLHAEFTTCAEALNAYQQTGKKALNAARIWAAIRDHGKDEEVKADAKKILAALQAALARGS